jgi:hypothetical protein
MQDYPQYLLQAQMVATQKDSSFDYKERYDINTRLGPYSIFFVLTGLLHKLLPIEAAGKVIVSFYLLLVALLALRAADRLGSGEVHWGLLLLFPFAFNQHYYLGNINYILSLPILFLALMDHEKFAREHVGVWPTCRHGLWLLALFLSHPFSFLAYICFSYLSAIASLKKRAEFIKSILPPTVAILIFIVWYFLSYTKDTTGIGILKHVTVWRSFKLNLIYYSHMFTGMRWRGGVDKTIVTVWIAVFAVILIVFFLQPSKRKVLIDRHLIFFLLATLAVFILPFRKGVFTYINQRFSPISYFLLAMLVGKLRFQGVLRSATIILVLTVLTLSVTKQNRISREIQDIAPIATQIPPRVILLPLVFNNDSPELDRFDFDIHLHVYNYPLLYGNEIYHPYFFKSPLFPVHPKPILNRPAPSEYYPGFFRWERHSSDYQYFLLRSAPTVFIDYMKRSALPLFKSGQWILMKRSAHKAPESFAPSARPK